MSALSDEAPTAGLLHLASFFLVACMKVLLHRLEGSPATSEGNGLLPAGFGEGRPCSALSQGSRIREWPCAAVRAWAWRGSCSMALTKHLEDEE